MALDESIISLKYHIVEFDFVYQGIGIHLNLFEIFGFLKLKIYILIANSLCSLYSIVKNSKEMDDVLLVLFLIIIS